MKMRNIVKGLSTWTIIISLVLLLAPTDTHAASYSEETKKALIGAFNKKEFPGYTFRGTPVGTFGVGTIYEDDPAVAIESRWLLGRPDTWYEDSVSKEDRDKWTKRIIVDGDFGSVTLTTDKTKKINVGAILPNILQVIGINANVDLTRNVKVTLSADRATSRKIDWTAFKEAIKANVIRKSVAEVISSKNFVMCAADIVLTGYTININATRNTALNAQLDGKTKLTEKLGEGVGFKVGVSSTGTGTYAVKAADPVVAAVLFKAPPQGVGLNAMNNPAADNVDLWPVIDMSKPIQEFEKIAVKP